MLIFSPGDDYNECNVKAMSQSRSFSFYDFATNFCNLDVPLDFASPTKTRFDDCMFRKWDCVKDREEDGN